jgi:hypothetical protein
LVGFRLYVFFTIPSAFLLLTLVAAFLLAGFEFGFLDDTLGVLDLGLLLEFDAKKSSKSKPVDSFLDIFGVADLFGVATFSFGVFDLLLGVLDRVFVVDFDGVLERLDVALEGVFERDLAVDFDGVLERLDLAGVLEVDLERTLFVVDFLGVADLLGVAILSTGVFDLLLGVLDDDFDVVFDGVLERPLAGVADFLVDPVDFRLNFVDFFFEMFDLTFVVLSTVPFVSNING